MANTAELATVRDLIIDADSHVTEPPDVWTARVPAKYRDDVPQVVRRGRVGYLGDQGRAADAGRCDGTGRVAELSPGVSPDL